ncbi:VTT domain-containing protein [Candidatus Micrarchaeota archaeon]|nr:VTT domain-containing protein [Candidatus Micrarchaeota archaeon]
MVVDWLAGFFNWVFEFANTAVEFYGLLGLFVASIIANATLFLPLPITIVTFSMGALAFSNGWGLGFVVLVGIASGLGAAIGELSGYIAGFLGGKALDKAKKDTKREGKLEEVALKIEKHGMAIIFVGTFLPLPFDFFGIAAGLAKYNVKKFFVATAAGKIVRDILIASAGFFGFELIQGILF